MRWGDGAMGWGRDVDGAGDGGMMEEVLEEGWDGDWLG